MFTTVLVYFYYIISLTEQNSVSETWCNSEWSVSIFPNIARSLNANWRFYAAQMERTVVYGSARTGDSLIVTTRKSKLIQIQGRHDCQLTAACTNETQGNDWSRAHWR